MNEFFLLFFSLLTIFFINKFRVIISQKTNLIDKPNKVRKLHLKETSLLRGLMIYLTFIYINFFLYFFSNYDNMATVIFIISSYYFFIGLFDDNEDISYSYKLVISFILLFSLY